ncbi:outer membrane scaffolding protein for murein synthesis (MipA/OmpV family) [Orbus hercynius]|uniref:Outer membrane scaffolding protein for murein synthesis (MipA/OmpV family) n=1 Tax=Orbus hercynius TaxID=593135 RepID=A0A495RFP5_9GAMM|nr:MipA/OmpV family protein [Orbus hercynius]RKS86036.1 outer membrane scaffolding protein for murein synthesis (MipA/OmpV family) [Orbus hercynius]
MNKHLISLSAITTSLIIASFSAQATPISVGLGASWTDSPYKGYGAVYYPLPHIVFENEVFFINNFTAGAYLYNDNNQKISLGLSYLPLQFKPSDSDNHQMKQLDKRHSTVVAEARYSIATQYGNFATGIGADILNESNSVLIGASYSYPISGDRWVIEPKVGFLWANDKHNDYYYGVSHSEATRSGLAYHDAKSSFTPYVSLIGSYTLTQSFSTYVGVRVDKLTGDAKNSPMIANSTIPSVFAGINYSF